MGSTDGPMVNPQSSPTPGPSPNAAHHPPPPPLGPSASSAPTTPSGKFIEQINYGEIEEGEVSVSSQKFPRL